MSMPIADSYSLHEVESVIEAELATAVSSNAALAADLPVSRWVFDPADAQRDEVDLRSLLGAVRSLAGDSPLGDATDVPV